MRFIARLSFLLICASAVLFSCTKIEYTTLGVDLASEVNNVTTFDTTLEVTTETMPQFDDTLKLNYYDQLAVGRLNNDPLFGNTTADLYFELKPSSFSASATAVNFRDSSFLAGNDVGYDSTVLSLKFDGGYGDTAQQVTYDVYTLTDNISRLQDTIYPIVFQANFQTTNSLQLVGSKTVSLHSLTYDSVQINPSSTVNYKKTKELRIKLTDNIPWINLLKDSGALSDEIAYRTKFKGFAIKTTTNNSTPGSLAYFSISDTATRLQFYYRRKNAGVIDTTSTSFYFNHNNSGYDNNVLWDKNTNTSAEWKSHLNRLDSVIYVKTNPGTQVRIRIPGLENVSNRIIHRAELKTYIIPNDTRIDGYLIPPPALYLERYDTTTTGYLPIPIDLNPNELYGDCFPSTNGINYSYFGGYPRNDSSGSSFQGRFYAFNLSRYVQQIVTHQLRNSPLRLTANLNAQYANCQGGLPFRATSNVIGYGRAKLGGGRTGTSFSPYRMRLRIVYSKI